jgi:hypothetical protein
MSCCRALAVKPLALSADWHPTWLKMASADSAAATPKRLINLASAESRNHRTVDDNYRSGHVTKRRAAIRQQANPQRVASARASTSAVADGMDS